MRVCVIIVTWNCRERTLACLRALAENEGCDVVVVDNGSTDGSAEAIAAAFPAVELIRVGYNSGFAAAVNRGLFHPLARAAEFALLLNNDVELAPDALDRLLAAADLHLQVGIFSPAVFFQDRRERLWSSGYRILPLAFSTIRSERGRTLEQPHGLRRVDFVEFCAALIRRSLLERIGPLDERFFVYYEDLDFCLRAREAGFGVACVRDAHAWHAVSASTEHDIPARYYLRARSSVQFFSKHTPRALRLPVACYRSYSGLRVLGSALACGRRDIARAYLRGLADGIAA
jgi:GT2 family glycosyltransferase